MYGDYVVLTLGLLLLHLFLLNLVRVALARIGGVASGSAIPLQLQPRASAAGWVAQL